MKIVSPFSPFAPVPDGQKRVWHFLGQTCWVPAVGFVCVVFSLIGKLHGCGSVGREWMYAMPFLPITKYSAERKRHASNSAVVAPTVGLASLLYLPTPVFDLPAVILVEAELTE